MQEAKFVTGGTEKWRIAVVAKLEEWLASDEPSLTFPSDLSKEERRYLHEQAPRLGLTTKSTGSGEARFITVSKPRDASRDGVLELTRGVLDALAAHMQRFPASTTTELGSYPEPVEPARRSERRAGAKKSTPPPPPPMPSRAAKSVSKQQQRSKLPAWAFRGEVSRLVRESPVVLITGETGCGKSTQVPQFILDDDDKDEESSSVPKKKIACSQPRRLSAIAVAERVAWERGEAVGKSVGYEVRFESRVEKSSELIFMTPGTLLRKDLREYSHVILDEVHEEDADTEFLLIACRELARRREVKLVLMSATLASEKLADYFSDISDNAGCPVVSIGAKVFPVSTFYLEDALEHAGRVDSLVEKKKKAPRLSPEMLASLPPPPTLRCALCGRDGFVSPEELGDHAAACEGEAELVDVEAARDDLAVVADVLSTSRASVVVVPAAPERTMTASIEEEEEGECFEEAVSVLASRRDSPSSRRDPAAIEAAVRAYQRRTDDDAVDVELVCDLVRYIMGSSYEKGAILVFVPGWADIVDVVAKLEEDSRCHCVPLHSSLEASKQRAAFAPTPDHHHHKWKIVVATNVAETSITIPDVSFVVDAGLEKTLGFDRLLGASVLRAQRVSAASAAQREGRAGRTKPGVCFRLWTRRRHKALAPRRKSELLRANLDALCLRAATLCASTDYARDARAFLGKALNPPPEASVDMALRDLANMGALVVDDETPSALGELLARLPLSPRLGLAALYSRLLGASPALACALDAKDPFLKGSHSRAVMAGASSSDVVALYEAASSFRNAKKRGGPEVARAFCRNNSLAYSTLALVDAATVQLDSALPSVNKPPPAVRGLASALAVPALYPNIASRRKGDATYSLRNGTRCRLHAASLAAKKTSPYTSFAPAPAPQILAFGALLEFQDSNGRGGLAIATLSPASPLSLLLLCHGTLDIQQHPDDQTRRLLCLDGLRFRATDAALVRSVLVLRTRLRAALADLVAGRPLAPEKADAALVAATALLLEHASLNNNDDRNNPLLNNVSPTLPGGGGGGAARQHHSARATTPRKPTYAPTPASAPRAAASTRNLRSSSSSGTASKQKHRKPAAGGPRPPPLPTP
ncbi:hypothetical protein CTAYLR_007258 [Chrysophaeum taylorii]|uniref:RNA helicase n=1 Tax=Chrysophaeum taylorii TaxID=2483200 RepID=A0AAD7XJF8_9STRA|nr:hypothetical protein CTAYLR_007258 [Chrysophaeum taylorii]